MSERNKRLLAFWAIFALGLGVRLWRFGAVPEGINQDEAFAGYEAFCLLRGGMDTAGYRFPVYLTAWGSGMNALETYLMLPFVAAFGLKTWVIRLPQLLVGIASLPVSYLTARRLRDEKQALVTMLLLAICPWHVLLSRWGLESNLAPGFLLFGLYFFLRGMEDSRFFPLAGLFYGLSLYAYATVWPFVPLMLLLMLLYALRGGALRFDRRLLGGGAILALLAMPLLLFLAVNFGLIAEIRTPLFSVPKLLVMRSGELSLKHIPEDLKNLFTILWTQSDGLPWNTAGAFGLLYPLSLPFALLGLIFACARLRRGFDPMAFVLIQLLAALLLGATVKVNVNRVNILFIPLVFLTAEGLCAFAGLFRVKLLPLLLAAYLLCFGFFARYYFTDYDARLRASFAWGLEDALAAAERYDGTVILSEDVYYSDVLFYARTDPAVFRETVRYQYYPAAYLRAASFDRFRFGYDAGALEPEACYVLSPWTDASALEQAGFTLERYGYYTIATMR